MHFQERIYHQDIFGWSDFRQHSVLEEGCDLNDFTDKKEVQKLPSGKHIVTLYCLTKAQSD